MEKIVNRLINDEVAGADIYTKVGSTWLIFTERKEWVIELTKKGTLWYNYSFFKNLFAYLGFDVVENQHYITKWVEDNIQNGCFSTHLDNSLMLVSVEDTIQNGVKHTPNISLQLVKGYGVANQVENTIKNGVKETKGINGVHGMNVAIQNGVKCNTVTSTNTTIIVEETIQNGVKHTVDIESVETCRVEDTIQNGVKHTMFNKYNPKYAVENTIQNGVRYTVKRNFTKGSRVENTIQNGVKNTFAINLVDKSRVEDTVQNGVICGNIVEGFV
jgi:hypothetical protein